MKPGGPKEPKEPVEENESQYEIAVAPDPGEREEGEDPGGAEKEIQQEIEVAATAAVQVNVKLKGKVPEAGIAEVKVSGSTAIPIHLRGSRGLIHMYGSEKKQFPRW